MDLSGIFAPVTTPFLPSGEADAPALEANLRRWLQAPFAGVVLFGSTGEGPLLDEDEKVRLTAGARGLLDGGRLLLAGTGTESTRATIRASAAVAAAGADAVLVQPPAYFRPAMTQRALADHYRAVADASPVPVILYQAPPRFSTVELAPELVAELVPHPNIIGIKDSHGDPATLAALVKACGSQGQVLAGSGAVLLQALQAGAVGGILAVALLMPRQCADLYLAYREGRLEDAATLQARIAPLHQAVVAALGIPGMKAALDALGMQGGPPRPPLLPLPQGELAAVRAALTAAGVL
jgi:4-hydroxy-2-oxoglutarate aldolase